MASVLGGPYYSVWIVSDLFKFNAFLGHYWIIFGIQEKGGRSDLTNSIAAACFVIIIPYTCVSEKRRCYFVIKSQQTWLKTLQLGFQIEPKLLLKVLSKYWFIFKHNVSKSLAHDSIVETIHVCLYCLTTFPLLHWSLDNAGGRK